MSTVSLWPAQSLWPVRDPFQQFDALVHHAFGPAGPRPAVRRTGFVPAAEVVREGDDAVIRLELPGLDVANDVTVEVDRDQLVVRGERRDERTDNQDGRGPGEVRYGAFRRSFRLPAHVTSDTVSASYDAGVLSIRVAGAYASPNEAKRIPVASSAPAVVDALPESADELDA